MGYLRADGMPAANASGIVKEESASLQLIDATNKHAAGLFLYIEKINISVYVAAVGGAGLLTIQTDDAEWVWHTDTDSVKDFAINWGEAGVKIGTLTNPGLQAFVSGADTQASVSVGITAHYDRR